MYIGKQFFCAGLIIGCLLCLGCLPTESNADATFIPTKTYSTDVSRRSSDFYNKGTQLLSSGKYQEALSYFHEAVKESRGNVDAWDHMGICYRRTGEVEKAIKAYETSIGINAKNPVPYANLGLIYCNILKDYKKALTYYEKVMVVDPTDPEGYYGAAQVNEKLENHNEAIKNYLLAAGFYEKRNSPVIGDAYFGLGLNYALKKPPENVLAAEFFFKAHQAGRELPPEIASFVKKVRGN